MFLVLLSIVPGVIGSFIVNKEIKEINNKLRMFNPNVPDKESFMDYMKNQWLWYLLLFAPFGANILISLPLELYYFNSTKRYLNRIMFMPHNRLKKEINDTNVQKPVESIKTKSIEPMNLDNMDIAVEREYGPVGYHKSLYRPNDRSK